MHFKELLTTEVQIKRVNKYWPEEISVWVITHPDDYTLAMERIFFESKASWKTYRMVLLEEVEDEPEKQPEEIHQPEEGKTLPELNTPERNKLLSDLHIEMIKYAKFKKQTIEQVKSKLLWDLWLSSRTDMNDQQIRDTIDSMYREMYGV